MCVRPRRTIRASVVSSGGARVSLGAVESASVTTSRAVQDALAELREGLHDDPAALRASIANLMREVADAQIGLWYRFGLVEGEPYPVEWSLVGAHSALLQDQSTERIPWPAGDPRLPDPTWCARFVAIDAILPAGELEQTELYNRCYAPIGIHDQIRMMLYSRGRHVAWVGALRTRGESPFGRKELNRLRAISGPIADALVCADATARAAGPHEGADLVMDSSGRVEFASDAAQMVLAHPDRGAMLAAWARHVERSRTPPRVLAGHTVRWCRLSGSGGSRYLLHLEPIEPVRLGATFELSRTQRRVAEYAAAGVRVAEIAEELGVAATTVRTHLRAVYETLGVANRVELAAALAGPAPCERD